MPYLVASSHPHQSAAELEREVFGGTRPEAAKRPTEMPSEASLRRAEARSLIQVWEALRHDADAHSPLGGAGADMNRATVAGLIQLLAKPSDGKTEPPAPFQLAAPDTLPLHNLRVSRRLEACDVVLVELVRQEWSMCAERGALLESVRGVLCDCMQWEHGTVTRLVNELRDLPLIHQRHHGELEDAREQLAASRAENARLQALIKDLEHNSHSLEERLGSMASRLDNAQADALAANERLYTAEQARLGRGMVSRAVETDPEEAIAGSTAWAWMVSLGSSEQTELFKRLGAVGRAEIINAGAPPPTIALLLSRLPSLQAAEALALAEPTGALAVLAMMRSTCAADVLACLCTRTGQRLIAHALAPSVSDKAGAKPPSDDTPVVVPAWLSRACAMLLDRQQGAPAVHHGGGASRRVVLSSGSSEGGRALANLLAPPEVPAHSAALVLVKTLDHVPEDRVVALMRKVLDEMAEGDVCAMLPHLPVALARFVLTLGLLAFDAPADAPPPPPTMRTLSLASRMVDADDGRFAATFLASYLDPAGGAKNADDLDVAERNEVAKASAAVAFGVVLGLSAPRQAKLLLALHRESQISRELTVASLAFTRACLGATAIGEWQRAPTATRRASAELLSHLMDQGNDDEVVALLSSLTGGDLSDALEAAHPVTAAAALAAVSKVSDGAASNEAGGPSRVLACKDNLTRSERIAVAALSAMSPNVAAAVFAALPKELTASFMRRLPHHEKTALLEQFPANPLAYFNYAGTDPEGAAAVLMNEAVHAMLASGGVYE